MAHLDKAGHEVVSSVPVAVPLGYRRPPSLAEQVKSMVRNELSRAATEQGLESFEEADDFDIGDDAPKSPYELDFDQETAVIGQEEIESKELSNGSNGRRSAVNGSGRGRRASDKVAPVVSSDNSVNPAVRNGEDRSAESSGGGAQTGK